MAGWMFVGLLLVVCGVLSFVTAEIIRFRWWRGMRRIRFSSATLLVLMTVIALSFGIARLDHQADAQLALPVPVLFVICLLILGGVVCLGRECGLWLKETTVIESYRARQDTEIQLPQGSSSPAGTTHRKRGGRRKWWLRRIPNRFRSISHRDFQYTPISSFYSNR